jgi:putative flippase GtrA
MKRILRDARLPVISNCNLIQHYEGQILAVIIGQLRKVFVDQKWSFGDTCRSNTITGLSKSLMVRHVNFTSASTIFTGMPFTIYPPLVSALPLQARIDAIATIIAPAPHFHTLNRRAD